MQFMVRRVLFSLLILFAFTPLSSQYSFFSQYNGNMGGLNPAMIASVDKNQVSILGRSQWRNHPNGALMGSLSANFFFPKHSHSLGVFSDANSSWNNTFNQWSAGLRWGYRVLFLEKYYLCAGIGVRYTDLNMPVYYLYDAIGPDFAPTPLPQGKRSITTDYGLMFHATTGRYLGLSLKDVLIPVLEDDSSSIFAPGKTLGIQALHNINVSREAKLMFFLGIDRGGSIEGVRGNFTLWQLQMNYYQHNAFVLGMGYKRVGMHYGMMNYRFALLPWKGKVMIGYSFDSKPYINNNKIHWNSSHEIMLKIRLPEKNN